MKIHRRLPDETMQKISFTTGAIAVMATVFAVCVAECIPLSISLFVVSAAFTVLTARIEKQL